MLKVGIIGATGYTGAELVRLLVRHSHVRITYLSTKQYVGKAFSDVFPAFKGVMDLTCSELDTSADADLFFSALPHHESYAVVKPLLESGKKVIDLSADFRIRDYAIYKKWYGDHACFELVKEAAYGIPEIYREEIAKARLVANPGCYPTSSIIPLYPLAKEGIIQTKGIIIDSKSGVTGAGRGLSLKTHFCEVYGGLKAYSVAQHRHQPEIEEKISELSGESASVLFTPHLLPVKRGILSTIYASLKGSYSESDIFTVYEKYYRDEKFIRLFREDLPSIEGVVGSNFCDFGFKINKDTGHVVIISVIDNLTKGASGQAVQNMNLMAGFPEDHCLDISPLYP